LLPGSLFAGNAGAFLRIYPLAVPTKQYQVIDTTWPLPGAEGYAIAINTASGKFDPATFVLRAGENLNEIRIHTTALVGPGTIPADHVDIRVVKTWYQASSGNCSCGARAITGLQLTNTSGGVWNTYSQDGYWSLGVASSLDSALMNRSDDSMTLAVSDGSSFKIFAADSKDSMYFAGTAFRLTATFADGNTASADATIASAAAPPPISLSYDGRLRDRVGQAEFALHADGQSDGVFTMKLNPGSGARAITRLYLTNNLGGVWNTEAPDIFWALGVATGLDAALINASDDSLGNSAAEVSTLKLFAADYHQRMYSSGVVFTLTAQFSDGSSASASAIVP